MLKVINPQVIKFEYKHNDKAQKLGTNAALLFQHICYWMQTQGVDVVFRTNQQLSEDLEGALSVSQVARAKAKLIQAGLITIAQDLKSRFIHTTHYRLTTIGEQVVMSLKNIKHKVVKTTQQSTGVVKQATVSLKQATNVVKQVTNDVVSVTKAVVEDVTNSDKEMVAKVELDETTPVELADTTKVELDETTLLLIEEQAQLEGKTTQEVADQYLQTPNNTTVKPVTQNNKAVAKPKKWIPKEEYKAMKQAEFKQQQNKEMCVSKAMQESFKQGFSNPNATKGIPADVLEKLPSFLKKRIK